MTDNLNTNKVKVVQYKNLAILASIVIIALTSFIYMMSKKETNELTINNEKTNFANPFEHMDAESTILEKTQKQLHDAQKKTDDLQQQINALTDKNKAEEQSKLDVTQDLKKRMNELEKQVSHRENNLSPSITDSRATTNDNQVVKADFLPTERGSNLSQNGINENINGDVIREDSLSLTPRETKFNDITPLRNPETYVPAGTFAKAVMIGGADASAAVNAQTNPAPMIFRIIANGTLPNHKKSHLKDCIVTAAVVGDISSERGLIRLENLSCVFPNNEVVDQAVEGTIFGPEGKNGVRGIPVWRESALLQRAFVAGTLSGLADGLSQTYTTNSISPLGNTQTVNNSEIFKYGAAQGMGKAMDKLADYNIQRAEQYHPVIQLSAGTIVDVVFLRGFFLDGKKHEENNHLADNETLNHSPSLFPEPSSNLESQALPLSPDAVRRIEEKSKELGLRVSTQTDGS